MEDKLIINEASEISFNGGRVEAMYRGLTRAGFRFSTSYDTLNFTR